MLHGNVHKTCSFPLSLSRKHFLFVDRLAALLHSSNGFIVMVAIVHLSHQKIKLFND